jgi:hypothetical protein
MNALEKWIPSIGLTAKLLSRDEAETYKKLIEERKAKKESRPNEEKKPKKPMPFIANKAFFNYVKYIAILDAAAIISMITYLEKIFKKFGFIYLPGIAFAFFFMSLLCSLLILRKIAYVIWFKDEGNIPQENPMNKRIIQILVYWSQWGFFIGIILLGIFGAMNILPSGSGYFGEYYKSPK